MVEGSATSIDPRFAELCMACRVGDIENADRLISTGININSVDEYDNSPLFLASLCGHEEVVKLLLERGAACDRDKFEGARCIYGALTDSIRDILLSHDISKAVDLNQPFATHISSLIRDFWFFMTFDLTIDFSKEDINFKAHKFLLNILCPEFFDSNWLCDNDSIDLSSVTDSATFEYFLGYAYLLPAVHKLSHRDYDELIKFSEVTKLHILTEFLHKSRTTYDAAEKSTLVMDFQFKFREYLREALKVFVEDKIINNYEENLNNVTNKCLAFHDIYLRVQNHDTQVRYYPCHLAILERAPLFQLVFNSNFREKSVYISKSEYNDSITVNFPNCDFNVVEIILRYLYYDCPEIPIEYAAETVVMADILLEDRLKAIATANLVKSKSVFDYYSVFDILKLGWEMRSEKLEHFAAKEIAENLFKYEEDQNLKQAILESSQRISARQETDTIELVDDIRYYLVSSFVTNVNSDIVEEEDYENIEYQKRIAVVNKILRQLNIDA